MRMQKHLIFVVILFLAGALVYTSYSGFEAFAYPRDPDWGKKCEPKDEISNNVTCCWTEEGNPGETFTWCQTCESDGSACGPVVVKLTRPEGIPPDGGVLDPGNGSSTPPPSGPAAPLQDGGVLQQSPSEGGGLQPLTRGQGVLPQDGILQQQQQPPIDQRAAEPPATTEPATVEEEQPVPVCQDGLELNEDLGFCVPTECPEGQELDEETGLCVLEEPEQQEQVEEEPEEQETEEQEQPEIEENQPTEETDLEDSNNN